MSKFEQIPTAEQETIHTHELEIADNFWSLVQQRLGLPNVPNPGFIKIKFSSYHPKVNEKSILEEESFDVSKDIVIQGILDYDSHVMHFNIDPDEVEKNVIAEVIAHELVHYAQIEGEKYEKMKPPFNNDKNLPWEKEAYRLMYPLAKQLLKNFKLNEVI